MVRRPLCALLACLIVSVAAHAQEGRPDAQKLLTEAASLRDAGKFVEAADRARRAVTLYEQDFGPEHPIVATALTTLGRIQFRAGDYTGAEASLARALAIREASFSAAPNEQLAQSLNDLSQTYQAQGKFYLVEPLLQRALELRLRLHGNETAPVAESLNNLGGFYTTTGQHEKARPLFERALDIRVKIAGPDNLVVAQALNNLASLLQRQGDLQGSANLFARAAEMRERNNAPPQDLAGTLNNLATVHQERGDLDAAEPLYRRALALYESALGPRHQRVGQTLSNLAVLLFLKGRHTEAEPIYLQALAVRESTLGPRHPDVAVTLAALSVFYDVTGKRSDALRLQARALDIIEQNLRPTLAVGSEAQKLAYLKTLTDAIDITFSLRNKLPPDDQAASAVAATLLFRRKGRVLDVVTQLAETVRDSADPVVQQQLRELAMARANLSRAVLQGHSTGAAEYRAAIEKLDNSLSKQAEAPTADLTVDRVQAAIPDDAVLVEFLAYRPFDPTEKRRDYRFGPPRYVAYVLTRTGNGKWVELGPADPIDRSILQFRRAITTGTDDARGLRILESGTSVTAVAAVLYRQLIEPVQPLLGNKNRLLIAPDASLNLLPFAALRAPDGRYLLEMKTVTYVTSGRDLVRSPVPAAGAKGTVAIFAAPAFDQPASSRVPRPSPSLTFGELPGAEEEARSISRLLPDARTYFGRSATETEFKRLRSPHVLHVATHGFFTRGMSITRDSDTRGLTPAPTSSSSSTDPLAPLLRAGLAFAGANTGGSDTDDGILTALEAMSLQLSGTKLVVLSACDTGLGEIYAGESVYGMRRALAVAGAEAQIMTLWQVSDAATRDLMTSFYEQLASGMAPSAAIRHAQLRMMRSARWAHPAYWAPFVPAGRTDVPLF